MNISCIITYDDDYYEINVHILRMTLHLMTGQKYRYTSAILMDFTHKGLCTKYLLLGKTLTVYTLLKASRSTYLMVTFWIQQRSKAFFCMYWLTRAYLIIWKIYLHFVQCLYTDKGMNSRLGDLIIKITSCTVSLNMTDQFNCGIEDCVIGNNWRTICTVLL